MASGGDRSAFSAFREMERTHSMPKKDVPKTSGKGAGTVPEYGSLGQVASPMSRQLDDMSSKLTQIVGHMSSISQSLDQMTRRLTTLEQRTEDVERFIAEQRSLRVTVGATPTVAKSLGARPIM